MMMRMKMRMTVTMLTIRPVQAVSVGVGGLRNYRMKTRQEGTASF